MAFNKLIECDRSDIAVWAGMPACKEFVREIADGRDKCLRDLIKKPTEENASMVRVYDKILGFIEEAQRLK